MNSSAISGVHAAMLDKMEMQAKIASNPFDGQNTIAGLAQVSENLTVSESNLKFGSAIKSVLDGVNQQGKDAESQVRAVELGLSDDLIGATIATQKASLSFNALMQVRNKMVSNFHDIYKMSI